VHGGAAVAAAVRVGAVVLQAIADAETTAQMSRDFIMTALLAGLVV